MYRSRQNIIKRQSSASSLLKTTQNVFNEYGIELNQNDQKKLTKSKSHKDVLIAKNKKLIDCFRVHQKKSSLNLYHIDKPIVSKNHSKLTLTVNKNIYLQKSAFPQQQIQTFRTSCFGGISKIQDKKTIRQKEKTIALQQVLQSDRIQAKNLKQRLKKSTSMRNLIQQCFLSQNQQQKLIKKIFKENIYTQKIDLDYASQTYDSSKYNWRISRSKEKQSKQKSLSSLQLKAKMLHDIRIKQKKINKLHLDQKKDNNGKQKIEKHQYIQNDYKNYTFGSDLYRSIHFH